MKLYPNITLNFIIWVLAIITVFYFGFTTVRHTAFFSNNFIESFANWDGGHYLGISDGYDKEFQYAFFPLYPILINLLGKITGSSLWAGIIISAASSFLAVNLLYRLVSMEFGKQNAKNAVMALLLFPMSFYFLTVYTESLFLLLTIAVFYFARKNQILTATILAAFASGTRLAGLAIVLALWANVYLKQSFKKNWYVILAPLGFILYSIFLYTKTGDPLYFVTAENHWQRQAAIPGLAIAESFKALAGEGILTKNFNVFLDYVFAIFGIGMIIRIFRKLSFDYAVFAAASLLLPLSSPTLHAIPRYILTIFPIFIMISLTKNQYALFAYQIFSTLLLAVFAVLFITGYRVT